MSRHGGVSRLARLPRRWPRRVGLASLFVAFAAPAQGPAQPDPTMVEVPAGPFYMGCNEAVDTDCYPEEKPGRTVDVAAFRIDRTEVTVADYRRCVAARHCSADGVAMPYWDNHSDPEHAPFCNWTRRGHEQHPMNCVSWEHARAYCGWAGKRLPTEAEWEKAARGTQGRKYPWGSLGYQPGVRLANIADETAKRAGAVSWIAAGYEDGHVGTAPVGSFPAGASPYGALDMIGNVWEWILDPAPTRVGRGARGGSWQLGPRSARASCRGYFVRSNRFAGVGFRCAESS